MTSATSVITSVAPARSRAVLAGLWTLQVLLAVMYVAGSGLPKIVGEAYAVQIFDDLGGGTPMRLVVGLLEIAGGIGLLVLRLAGLAATCLVALMVGATGAQLLFLDEGYWFTPVIFGLLLAVVAWVRRAETVALFVRRWAPGYRGGRDQSSHQQCSAGVRDRRAGRGGPAGRRLRRRAVGVAADPVDQRRPRASR